MRQFARPATFLMAMILASASTSWGQPAGNSTGREAACEREEPPERYRQFLNTSFIGPAQKINVGFVNFTYHRFGPLDRSKPSGRTLVMIAGVRCTLSTWTPDLLKTLAATRELVVFDNAGAGLSLDADGPDNISIENYAESTLDLIFALDIQQPDILGWSMGGVIALWIATHSSEEVNRFIIVNSAAGAPPGAASTLPPPKKPSPDPFRETLLDATAIFPDTPAGNTALCRYVKLRQEMPKDGVTNEVAELQLKAVIEFVGSGGVLPLLANVTNPTLVVVGSAGGELPSSLDILSGIPNSALLAYGDAGHGGIFQHSLSAAAAISNFLDNIFE